jgi:hypothetical protein
MPSDTELDRAIAIVEGAGLTIVTPRDSKDEQLRSLWDNAMKTLRMARDVAEDGGKLTVRHSAWLNPSADVVGLLRSNAVRLIDDILTDVVIVLEKRDAA